MDHLFDRGFISFEDAGSLIISPVAHAPSLNRMGVATDHVINVGTFTDGQKQFLDYHRESVLLQARHQTLRLFRTLTQAHEPAKARFRIICMKQICVFCGSSQASRPEYGAAAEEMAAESVRRNIWLVYGGTKVGLMGVLMQDFGGDATPFHNPFHIRRKLSVL